MSNLVENHIVGFPTRRLKCMHILIGYQENAQNFSKFSKTFNAYVYLKTKIIKFEYINEITKNVHNIKRKVECTKA